MNFFTIGGVGITQFFMGQVADGIFDPAQPQQTYSVLYGIYGAMIGVTLVIYLFSSDRKPGQHHG